MENPDFEISLKNFVSIKRNGQMDCGTLSVGISLGMNFHCVHPGQFRSFVNHAQKRGGQLKNQTVALAPKRFSDEGTSAFVKSRSTMLESAHRHTKGVKPFRAEQQTALVGRFQGWQHVM